MIQSKSQSCRGCIYNNHGDCWWFVEKNRGRPKSIPIDTYDKGCKQRVARVESIPYHPITARLIEVFQGELI
jgi:hypothetical protein